MTQEPQATQRKGLYGLKFFIAFLVFTILFMVLKTKYHFGINEFTESLPDLIFVVEKGNEFERGNLVEFSYKNKTDTPMKMYFEDGSLFIKQVIGMPGDDVNFKDGVFYINGIEFGRAKEHAKDGKKLERNVTKTLGKDEYFVFTQHKDSFDSRYAYVGYINKSQVVGKVVTSFWEK